MIEFPGSARPVRDFGLEEAEPTSAISGRYLVYSGVVDSRLLAFVADVIRPFQRPQKKDPCLVLYSCGGDVYTMNAILDLMDLHGRVSTIATGACMSAAVPIIAAGRPGHRYATPRTRFMLHAGSIGVDSSLTLDELRAESTELNGVEDNYAQTLAKVTKKTAAWWRDNMSSKSSRYLSAQEAKKLGIIDHIITSPFPAPKRKQRKK